MRNVGRLREKRVMNHRTKLYFATDIHGSERCFRKFLNAAKFYGAEVLIMGGDIAGKAILFLTREPDGSLTSRYMGNNYNLQLGSELDDFLLLARSNGYYPYAAPVDELEMYQKDEGAANALFRRLMRSSIAEWLDTAETRLKPLGVRCFVTPGNDDPEDVAEVINSSSYVTNPEGRVVDLDDVHQMVSIGYSNPTPWNSPRECSEAELASKIDAMMVHVRSSEKCVLSAHVPPYDTGLDDAPALTSDLRVKQVMGQVQFAPAGSTAVLEAIRKYRYVLSLHGHIHEVHAIRRIGPTVCINPGSDYGQGVLHGVLAVLDNGRLVSQQLVSG